MARYTTDEIEREILRMTQKINKILEMLTVMKEEQEWQTEIIKKLENKS